MDQVQVSPGTTSKPTAGAKGEYERLASDREVFLERARDAAKLTIPMLVPESGHSSSSKYPTPWQGVGAQGVNNLASKLMLALLPPNSPFFRLVIDEYKLRAQGAKEQMNPQALSKLKVELEKALSEMEKAVASEVETTAIRVELNEALLQLIVGGNALLFIDPKTLHTQVYPLSSYVTKRDWSGNPIKIITKSMVSPMALPQGLQDLIKAQNKANGIGDGTKSGDVELYTMCVRVNKDKWKVQQEVAGIPIPESSTEYTNDKFPYISLRYRKVSGEDYGRGMVEDLLGDLKSLEALSQALVEGSAAAAKVLFLVKPNGTTQLRTLAQSANGAIVSGNAEDVTVLQLQKFNDFRVALETGARIEARLERAFLNNQSVQRQAERVTAEEIRFVAQELESGLGGVYSLLSQELQLPLVNLLMNRMASQNRLPKLKEVAPDGLIRPTIITGVDALGRGNDLNKLDLFLQGAIATIGPEAVASHVNISEYMSRRAIALGIDTEGLVKTDEEIQAEQQRAMLTQMSEKMGPSVINQFGQSARQQNELQAGAAAQETPPQQ